MQEEVVEFTRLRLMRWVALAYGVSLLFFIPYVANLRIMDIVLLTGILSIGFTYGFGEVDLALAPLMGLVLVFFLWSGLGSCLNTDNPYPGLMVGGRFLSVAILLYLVSSRLSYFGRHLIKGFVWAAVISSVYIFFDQLYYYFGGKFESINAAIFSPWMLSGLDPTTDITKRFLGPGGLLLLRSSGFGWDPGGIGPPLLIAYIIADHWKTMHRHMILAGIVLTLSRTTLISLLVYILYRFVRNRGSRLFSIAVAILVIAGAILWGYFYENRTFSGDPGTFRHIKYPGAGLMIFESKLREMVFGYGWRGSGEFYNQYAPWIASGEGFRFSPNAVAESMLANNILIAGVPGFILILGGWMKIFISSNRMFEDVLLFMILLSVGYNYENLWSISLLVCMLFLAFQGKLKLFSTDLGGSTC